MIFGICLICITSCGYHYDTSCAVKEHRTISVPYALRDSDGQFTAALIREITLNGAFDYIDTGGDLLLSVDLIEFCDDNIGFRYDRNKKGELTRSIIPTETRASLTAEITLFSSRTNCVIIGPVQVRASVDYDHDYYSSRDGVNVFSLGQLTDYEEAHDVVLRPLHKKLAKKIVQYIYESW